MIVINIRPFMKERKLNVQQLAERADISLNTARAYYFGVPTRVDLPILDAICKVLEVGPGDVLVQSEDGTVEDRKRLELEYA